MTPSFRYWPSTIVWVVEEDSLYFSSHSFASSSPTTALEGILFDEDFNIKSYNHVMPMSVLNRLPREEVIMPWEPDMEERPEIITPRTYPIYAEPNGQSLFRVLSPIQEPSHPPVGVYLRSYNTVTTHRWGQTTYKGIWYFPELYAVNEMPPRHFEPITRPRKTYSFNSFTGEIVL